MTSICTPKRGKLPRVLSDRILWTGGCVDFNYLGEHMHVHMASWLIKGSEKTVLVDSGHPVHWPSIEADVAAFLDGRPLDYVFLTHGEFPHAGLTHHWLKKYPNAQAVGDIAEFRLYYPDVADRFRYVQAGDTLDLGDRSLLFVPAIWRDLPDSLWAFETQERVLFVADAFSFVHFHRDNQCDFAFSEQPLPDEKSIRFINERALQWTRLTDVRTTFPDLDTLLQKLNPAMIAPAHGGIVDTPDIAIPIMKAGMIINPEIDLRPFADAAKAG